MVWLHPNELPNPRLTRILGEQFAADHQHRAASQGYTVVTDGLGGPSPQSLLVSDGAVRVRHGTREVPNLLVGGDGASLQRRLRCVDLGGQLHPAHDELLSTSSRPSFFLTSDWLDTWLECFGPDHDVLSLAVVDGDELIGAAPLVVMGHESRHGLRRLHFVGQWPTSGEHLDLLAAPSHETTVAVAVAEMLTGAMKRRWDVLTFQRMLAESPVLPSFVTALERAGCRTEVIETGGSPYTELPASLDDLLAGKSKNFRSQVRQSRKRVAQLGQVEILRLGDGLSFDDGFDELVHLHRARWAEASSFDTEPKIAFHRQLGTRLTAESRLFLSVLRAEGITVGARYDFVYDDKIWCIQGGWDPAHSSARPGMYLTADVMEWGIARGLREYDFLAGEGGYKTRWSTGSRPLATLVVANPSTVRGRLYGLKMARGRA